MCVFFFFMDFRGKRGDWGFVFECPICTQVLRGPLKLCQVCGSTSWVGHVIFMPKYGSFDVSQVTWAKYSMLIGRENFCCAVIGRDLLETPSLLVVIELLAWLLKCRVVTELIVFSELCTQNTSDKK